MSPSVNMCLGKEHTGIWKIKRGLWQCGVITATTLHLKEKNVSFDFLHTRFWFPSDMQQRAIDMLLGKRAHWDLKPQENRSRVMTMWCNDCASKGIKYVFWLPPQYLLISVWYAIKHYWSLGKEAANKTSSSSHGNCYVGVSRSQHSPPAHRNTHMYNYTCTQPLHDKRQCVKLLRELRPKSLNKWQVIFSWDWSVEAS